MPDTHVDRRAGRRKSHLGIYGQNEILKIATDEASKTNLPARFLPLGEREGPRRTELGAALARNRGELVKASEDQDLSGAIGRRNASTSWRGPPSV